MIEKQYSKYRSKIKRIKIEGKIPGQFVKGKKGKPQAEIQLLDSLDALKHLLTAVLH